MSDFSHCDYRAAQMKHTVLYGSARTGDYLIMAIKKSQRVPFNVIPHFFQVMLGQYL